MHPLHASQVNVADLAVAGICGQPIVQHAWQQSDRVGREEVAQAIDEAERDIAAWLGFDVAPRFIVDERISNEPGLIAGRGWNGLSLAVRLNRGHVISGGVVAKSLIDSDATIVYSDSDGDGYSETATVSVSTALTDEQEIAVFYPGESGAAEWEIRPLNDVTITGGVATIRFRREQCVLPELMEQLVVREVNGLDDTKFLETVDVYRKFLDPQRQTQFIWEGGGCVCCGSGGVGCGACSLTAQDGCLVIRDYRLGMVSAHPAEWNAEDDQFDYSAFDVCGRGPQRLRMWYRAGYRDMSRRWPNLQMASEWERAVAYLALAKLDRPLCGCSTLQAYSQHWSTDLAHRTGTSAMSSSFQLSRRVLDNPLGTTRGAMYAWNMIKREKLGRAALNG